MRLHAVSKQFGDQTLAVQGVDLTLAGGELLGLVGANGSGKSTLLGIMAGQIAPTSGKLELNQSNHTATNSGRFRRAVGLATQDRALDPELTVHETLAFFAVLFDIKSDQRATRVQETVDQLDMKSFAVRRVSKLSGGQRQRVHLALLFLQLPSVMLLDEPTSGLDPQMRDKFYLLLQASLTSGRTIVVATHDLDGCESLFDRVAFLSHGKLVAVETPHTLLAKHATLATAYGALCGEPLNTNVRTKARAGSGRGVNE